jgi:hypothetical protein
MNIQFLIENQIVRNVDGDYLTNLGYAIIYNDDDTVDMIERYNRSFKLYCNGYIDTFFVDDLKAYKELC